MTINLKVSSRCGADASFQSGPLGGKIGKLTLQVVKSKLQLVKVAMHEDKPRLRLVKPEM